MTNNAGWAPIPKTDRVNYILGVKGNDSVAVCDYNSWQPSYSNEWTYRSNIYTDLPLYHPGDTVRFATIVYKYDKSNRNLCNNLTATAILRDTNNQQIDTLLLCTDEYGRAEGAFVVPKDGLTGTFRISIKNQEHKLNDVQPFKVSDYKLPTFEIRGLIAKQDSPSNGDVTISGEAITYSGFQVANATIQLSLSVSKRLWWRQASTQSFYALEHATDSIGKFSIVLPNELLCDAPIVNGTFTADIVITNTSGESQSASIKFTQGARYSIEAAFSSCLDISSNRISLPIRTIDAMGTAVFSHVSYTLSDDSDVVKSGSFDTATPTVDWHDVASGKYTLTLTNDTDTTSVNDLVLYRIADNIPPIETPLWVPITELTAPCGSIASIRYGTTNKSAHIMVIVSDNDSIISRQWQTPKPGNHTFNVTVPKTGMPLHVTFITVCDYTFTSKTVSITASDVAQNLCIDIESFRDHITPGESEKWNITVTDNLGTPQSSAVMLDMYAKAIDRLASANWQFIAAGYPQRWRLSFSAPQSFKTWSTTNNSDAIRLKQNTINIPGWQLYGQSFIGSPSGLRVLASRKFTAANMAQTTAISGTYTDAGATETAKAESADTTDAEAVQDDTDNSTTSYRMPELPIAIFEPRLTTDAQGRLLYSFTAPNANTTWRLSVLAISPNLLSGSTIRDIVSNKPIMVQPNMPRFLRTGDCATIRASVMNNTDSTATVTTLVEVFDPASGAIINSSSAIDTIAPNSSIIVGTEVTAPECPMIGYRIRSTAGHYTDGEQSIITILPSSTPIIDAEPFYIAPNEKEFAKQLPNMPGNANVTLQFCENPAWYCATALPGLRSDDANSALSASAAIFSAAIADGLLKSNPVLAHTIRSWQVSDKNDSTLTSMLSRNAELKTVLLNATPWMMDAGSQAERMTRLALLFDKNEMAATYSKCIKLLTKLQRNDGGWSWVEQSHDSSPWITYNVLGMMGRLKQLGWLPNNKELNVMIEKAVAYIDDINARNYAKYPHADYTTYVITRDYFPDIQQPSTAKRVTTSTVQRLISEWQTQSVTDKAVSALILNNHNYNASAKQILASLREYAKTTAEQGMWWPSLDSYTGWAMGKIGATALILEAFSSVDANCSDIDLIRQWLILQKEAKDWGTSVTTSNVIAAILHTGTQWIVPAHTAKVLIGTYEIDMTQADNATGYIRTNISALHPSGKTLSITKEPTGPAWGAVYYRFTGTMSKVKAQHCEAVSIDKKLLVRHITPTGFVWEESDSLQLGDKVKVQLTIHASRDMDYVAIIDDRAAALEPVEQLPEPIYSDGICFYRENRDSSTRIFITHLPKGTYILDYELYTNTTGVYSSGIATLQSQYAPQLTAHSAGQRLNVVE
jgi:hypothetical protein